MVGRIRRIIGFFGYTIGYGKTPAHPKKVQPPSKTPETVFHDILQKQHSGPQQQTPKKRPRSKEPGKGEKLDIDA